MNRFAVGFICATLLFASVHFTADSEDKSAEQQDAEYSAYLTGLTEGSRQASLKRCDTKAYLTEGLQK